MIRLLFAAALLVAVSAAHAQPRSSADVVSWTASATPTPRGARVVVTGQIAPGWRVYAPGSALGRPLELTIPTGDGVRTAAPVRTSRPLRGRDASTGLSYLYFAGRVRLEVPVRSSTSARRLQGQVSFTACNDDVCLRPSTVEFMADVPTD